MASITYTANARAPLVSGHVAGTEYSFDVDIRAHAVTIDVPKASHISLGGNTETVLQRSSEATKYTIAWPTTTDDSMREFLYSIAAGEGFTFDAFGTIAVPVDPIAIVSVDKAFKIARLTHGATPWYSVSMSTRTVV